MEIKVKLREKESNVCSFIGWDRLIDHLRRSGEITKHEIVTNLKISETGIHYFVEVSDN